MLPKTIAVVLGVTLLAATPASGAESREDVLQRLKAGEEAFKAAMASLQAKRFDEAAAKFREADALVPGNSHILYNMACALSLSGKNDDALDALEKAIKAGFADHAHAAADDDLKALRETERFKACIELAKKRAQPKPPILHVPAPYDAKGERTYPLVVVLHGDGGTPDGMVRAVQRGLGAENCFVLGPYGSETAGPGRRWNTADLPKVIAEIQRLKKEYRIGKVYLHGFSAGAHIGYVFVLKHREMVDGFIPMAGALRRNMVTDDDLKRAAGLPVFAIQGTADQVVPLRAAELALETMKKNGAVTKMFQHTGGHTAPPDFGKVLADAVKWMESAREGEQ